MREVEEVEMREVELMDPRDEKRLDAVERLEDVDDVEVEREEDADELCDALERLLCVEVDDRERLKGKDAAMTDDAVDERTEEPKLKERVEAE